MLCMFHNLGWNVFLQVMCKAAEEKKKGGMARLQGLKVLDNKVHEQLLP